MIPSLSLFASMSIASVAFWTKLSIAALSRFLIAGKLASATFTKPFTTFANSLSAPATKAMTALAALRAVFTIAVTAFLTALMTPLTALPTALAMLETALFSALPMREKNLQIFLYQGSLCLSLLALARSDRFLDSPFLFSAAICLSPSAFFFATSLSALFSVSSACFWSLSTRVPIDWSLPCFSFSTLPFMSRTV